MKKLAIVKRKSSRNPYAHLASSRARMLDGDESEENASDDGRPCEGEEGTDDDPSAPSKPVEAVDDGDDAGDTGEDDPEAAMDEEDEKADEDDDKVLAEADDDETSDRLDASEREKDRCAAIFRRKASALNPSMAAHLAFGTNLSRKEAVALLEASVQGMSRSEKRTAKRQAYSGNSQTQGLRSRQRSEAVRPASPNAENGNKRENRLLAVARKQGLA
ncbi:hypothetical protein FAI40_01680 [Acetobacteraceae bacterium]|nr:hypothetical protein FAI40_01680 [Acetobacteraceae bacterium]